LAEAFSGWRQAPLHRANMLNADVNHVIASASPPHNLCRPGGGVLTGKTLPVAARAESL
jgi:hypothetical protein